MSVVRNSRSTAQSPCSRLAGPALSPPFALLDICELDALRAPLAPRVAALISSVAIRRGGVAVVLCPENCRF
jgi:hypothetical protein